MRVNNYNPVVILELNQETIEQDKALLSEFLGYEYKREALVGSYKGVVNPSYIFECSDIQSVLTFAKEHKQESILYLDNQRNAYLYFTNGDVLPLGEFKGVSESKAKAQDAYTYNPETNQYYIAE